MADNNNCDLKSSTTEDLQCVKENKTNPIAAGTSSEDSEVKKEIGAEKSSESQQILPLKPKDRKGMEEVSSGNPDFCELDIGNECILCSIDRVHCKICLTCNIQRSFVKKLLEYEKLKRTSRVTEIKIASTGSSPADVKDDSENKESTSDYKKEGYDSQEDYDKAFPKLQSRQS